MNVKRPLPQEAYLPAALDMRSGSIASSTSHLDTLKSSPARSPVQHTLDIFSHAFPDAYQHHPYATILVSQGYFRVSRHTGRGFTVRSPDAAPDAPPLFTVASSDWGKHRVIVDGDNGQEICSLQRNWTSSRKAWVLRRSGDGKEMLTLTGNYGSGVNAKITLGVEVHDPDTGVAGDHSIAVDANDQWGGRFDATAGSRRVLSARCENMKEGWMSAFKVSPPAWTVDIAPGVNLLLVSVCAPSRRWASANSLDRPLSFQSASLMPSPRFMGFCCDVLRLLLGCIGSLTAIDCELRMYLRGP